MKLECEYQEEFYGVIWGLIFIPTLAISSEKEGILSLSFFWLNRGLHIHIISSKKEKKKGVK